MKNKPIMLSIQDWIQSTNALHFSLYNNMLWLNLDFGMKLPVFEIRLRPLHICILSIKKGWQVKNNWRMVTCHISRWEATSHGIWSHGRRWKLPVKSFITIFVNFADQSNTNINRDVYLSCSCRPNTPVIKWK